MGIEWLASGACMGFWLFGTVRWCVLPRSISTVVEIRSSMESDRGQGYQVPWPGDNEMVCSTAVRELMQRRST